LPSLFARVTHGSCPANKRITKLCRWQMPYAVAQINAAALNKGKASFRMPLARRFLLVSLAVTYTLGGVCRKSPS
jgi:hypothetical protein